VIGTLAVDGCAVWYNEEGPGQAAASPSPLLAVGLSNVRALVIAHPSTASVPTSYYSMWHNNRELYSCVLKTSCGQQRAPATGPASSENA